MDQLAVQLVSEDYWFYVNGMEYLPVLVEDEKGFLLFEKSTFIRKIEDCKLYE